MLYFDHNATTPVAPEVAAAFAAATTEVWGNPSSVHRAGQIARQKLEDARRTVAGLLGATATELVFTSGGTESNNLAVLGLLRNLPDGPKHVITTSMEHPSVLEPCRQLEREGVSVSYLRSIDEVEAELRSDTVLVSVIHANNETGAVNDLARLSPVLRERGIYLHSDGVQAAGKVTVDVRQLGADLYSVSAHKLYAPKGIGALYVRKGVPVRGIQFGGRHERERRAGTENVPSAVAFAKAVEMVALPGSDLRDRFESELMSRLPGVRINGVGGARLPNTSSVTFPGISGEALVIALDTRGMAVSSGSACSSGSTEPSHVLLAMGLSREDAKSSVRFSFGRYNTPQDIDALVEAIVQVAGRLTKHGVREALHA